MNMSLQTPLSEHIWSSDSLRHCIAGVPTPHRDCKRKAICLDNASTESASKKLVSSTVFRFCPQAHHTVCWEDLPHEVSQAVMDWIPTFQMRACLQMTCTVLFQLDKSRSPPRLDDFFHMNVSTGANRNVEMRNMRFGDQGARAVAATLQAQPCNVAFRLNLGSNGITDDGAESIAAAIATCPAKIKRIFLDDNQISDSGARALMNAITAHDTLVEFDLRSNCLTPSGVAEIHVSKNKSKNKALTNVFLNWQLPSSTYMADVQKNIDARMRCILVDWMHAVTFKMTRGRILKGDYLPTYFLAVSYLDRYLSQRPVDRKMFQLVGTACIFVATRHVENWPSDSPKGSYLTKWLADTTDNAYTVEQVSQSANDIQNQLLPQHEQPTAHDFLLRYLTWTGYVEETIHLGDYLLSLAALSNSLLQHGPDVVAAAAVLLSHDALGAMVEPPLPDWRQRLFRCSGINASKDLIPCADKLADLHASVFCGVSSLTGYIGPGNLHAPKRFSTPAFLRVSKVLPTRPSLLRFPLSPFKASSYIVQRDNLRLWKSCNSWETTRELLRRGDVVISTGVVRKVEGYNMLPIHPEGAVEAKFVVSANASRAPVGPPYASRLLMNTVDWTLYGAKRRRQFYL